jgi:hypothetical protein
VQRGDLADAGTGLAKTADEVGHDGTDRNGNLDRLRATERANAAVRRDVAFAEREHRSTLAREIHPDHDNQGHYSTYE